MKTFFYIWCAMFIIGLAASLFNPGHLLFSCVPAGLMAFVTYPEAKQEMEDRR